MGKSYDEYLIVFLVGLLLVLLFIAALYLSGVFDFLLNSLF
jgi:hypothetical protein